MKRGKGKKRGRRKRRCSKGEVLEKKTCKLVVQKENKTWTRCHQVPKTRNSAFDEEWEDKTGRHVRKKKKGEGRRFFRSPNMQANLLPQHGGGNQMVEIGED